MDGYKQKMMNLTVNPDYTSLIAVKHLGKSGENEHYHMVVKTDVKAQAFRVRMKNVFNSAKGNQHMSIKNWDGNIDAISYLFHEDREGYATPIIARKEVSDETIEKAKRRNNDVQTKIAQAKGRASWTIEEELLENYIKTKQSPNLHEIARDIVLHALRMDKYVPNDFLLKAMASKIQFKLLNGDLNREHKFASDYVARVYRLEYGEAIALAGGGGGSR